ncbi:unnamed protein product [Caenorhabditis auriculariae]|uniref:EndoU domain-containing protein n=1 Tax=Caenorhabditis auriculariae TaxID=2777116 RepID=A0A8S1H477_9PELO|nr:unnamed protein product [Caenorhabditis auriculariae]
MRFWALLAVCFVLSEAFPTRTIDGSTLTSALNALVALDVRPESKIVLDYQNQASNKDPTHDNAPKPFFTSVEQSVLEQPTYTSFADLLVYYNPDSNTAQTITPEWNSAIDTFLSSVLATPVMNSAWQFLVSQGLSSSDSATFKQQLQSLWFTPYATGDIASSSGFKSVFAGEIVDTKVTKFNNWLAFYILEAAGKINYHGWFSRTDKVDVSLQFTLNNVIAVQKSFLLDSSPEFELAAYTVCALSGQTTCNVVIDKALIDLKATTTTANGVVVISECYPTPGHAASGTTKKPKNNDADLQALVDQMWAADNDKPSSSDIKMDWGSKQTGNNDNSPNNLFTTVNEGLFTRPVYADLITTYNKDLFTPGVCVAEPPMTGFRKQYLQTVFDTFTATPMFQSAFKYLQDKKIKNTNDLTTFKPFLWTLWFGTYSRCKGTLGSSGWEHVFSGEWKGSDVDGQHNWVRYYLLQKDGQMNYHGYYSHDENLIGTFQYTWHNELKPKGGFFTGTSPAFDFSILTVCALAHSGSDACKFNIGNYPIYITSYTQDCADGTCLSTAYPSDES